MSASPVLTTDRKALAAGLIGSIPTALFIDGQWVPAASGETFDVENPATGTLIAKVAKGGAADAAAAINSAAKHQRSWAATSPRERSEILRRAYELILARQDDLALIMTTEMGKPLNEAKGEVAYAAEFFRWFSEEAVRIDGDHTTTGDGRNRIIVTKEPVGPCILITPWNFPLAMGTRKIGPAIAAGCTMVFKPAELTPLTALALTEILTIAGLPAGVLNIVTTDEPGSVVETWMDSGLARKVSFTGSTAVGKMLLEQASRTVMRTSMELGGNAPFIVCEDADLDKAVDGAMVAKMRNMGEACTAANRLFVHRSVAGEFATRLAAKMGALRVGDGAEDGTDVGPLVERKAVDKVRELVADAVARGATVLCGEGSSAASGSGSSSASGSGSSSASGSVSGGGSDRGSDGSETAGYFYLPTVLSDVDPQSELMGTEIFGPVAPIISYDTEDEVLELANDTPWGLVGYLFTQDIDRGLRMSAGLEVGMVGLNTGLVSNPAAPFGGVKQSGLGREGGRIGIDEFLEIKYLAIPRT